MKNVFKLISSLILIVLFTGSSSAQLTFWNDLYLYYPLNGNANDFSGNDLHGQALQVSPTTGVFNDSAGAYFFNGTNSMVIQNALSLGDSVTMSGWFYSEADSQACGLIYNGNTGSSGYGVFVKKPFGSIANGSWMGKTMVIVQGGVNEAYFNNAYQLPTNQWVHIALVRRGFTLEFYLDGTFQASAPYIAFAPFGEFSIGSSTQHIATGYGGFRGRIDEVMVFRSALQPQQVQKVFVANLNLTENKALVKEKSEVKILGTTPGSDQIIVMSNKYDIEEVQIIDFNGRIVETTKKSTNQKSVSIQKGNLKPGMYIAKAKTQGVLSSAKFVIL